MRLSTAERMASERDVSTDSEKAILEELRQRKYRHFVRLFQHDRGDCLHAVLKRRLHGSHIAVIGGTSIEWAKSELKRMRQEEEETIAHDVAVNWSCGRGI